MEEPCFHEMSGSKKHFKLAKIRGKRIVNLLFEENAKKDYKVLDFGCGYGFITLEIAKKFKKIYGVDINKKAIKNALKLKKEKKQKNVNFQTIKKVLPFKDNSFDIIISYQVIEHTGNQNNANFYLKEAKRVLKKNGLLYIATPNKLWPIEVHFKLPIIHWMPKIIKNFIAKKYGLKKFNINLFSLSSLKKTLNKNGFIEKNYTLKVIFNHKKYYLEKDFNKYFILFFKLLKPFNKLISHFTPSFIFICKKRS